MAFRRTWLNAEEKITSDFIFTEGPAADINGDVYLSDIPNNRIHKWDVDAKKLSTFREDSGGSNGLFFDKKGLFLACEGSDGMTIDNEGNIYLTTNAIVVYNKKGEKIETIEVTEGPANVCFGGKDKKTLFITARKSLYAVRMRVNGVK